MKTLLLSLFCLIVACAYGQRGYASKGLSLAAAPEQWYRDQVGLVNTSLVVGTYYHNTRKALESHANFGTLSWIYGTVKYRGQLFENIPLIYNLEEDILLTKHPDEFSYINQPIRFIQHEVEWFEVDGHRFVFFETSEPRGFLELIHQGNTVSLLAKRKKLITINSSNLTTYVQEDKYYFYQDGKMKRVLKRFNFWSNYKTHKKEIKAFIKNNRIPGMRKCTDEQLGRLMKYVDGLVSEKQEG